ncbi:MAG: polysaccharide biosynthesis C-terminal domain-containing protein [Clostridia bacterium]
MKRAKRFFINAVILACTTVFLRGAGVAFNVYITNRIGAEGIGLFGLIMSVYMLATTVASSGVNLAATRLVTEELALGCDRGMRKAMGACMAYTLFFGTLAACLLFCFAPQIGRYWLCDGRTIRPLYLLSVSLPFIALSSAMSGYFVAVRRIAKSASAQIFELVIKVAVTVFALQLYAERGIEYACIAVVGGGSVAEIGSFLYLFVLYRLEGRRKANHRECEGRYTRRLLGIALPVAVSSYLRSGLVTLEHLLVPVGLKKFGASASASLAQYGVVHGMVMPVLLFPSAVLGAFSGLLVPELTEFQKQGREQGICRIVTRALRTTLLFSVGAAGLFFAFSRELGMAVYQSGDAGLFIRFLAPLVLVMYTDGVVDAMLKGLNQQVYSMRYNIIDSAVSVVMIYTLLPRFGINGYLAVIFVTEILNAFLSVNRLIRVTDFKISIRRDIFLPCLAVAAAAYGVRLLAAVLFGSSLCGRLAVSGCIICAALCYLALLAVFGCLKRD